MRLPERRLILPANQGPRGYARAFRDDFDYQTTTQMLRTGGPSWSGYADGFRIWEPNNEYGTFDIRANDGQAGDTDINPMLYAWAGGFTPFSLSNSILTMKAGTCAAAGIGSQVPYSPVSLARYVNYGCTLTSAHSVRWTGDFWVEARMCFPKAVGGWANLWPFTNKRDILNPNEASCEIDIEFMTRDPQTLLSNLHGNVDRAGGAFQTSSGECYAGQDLRGVWANYAVWSRGDTVSHYINRIEVRRQKKNPAWVAWNDPWYFRLNNDVGDAASGPFPGTYTGSPDPSLFQIDWIDLWLPGASLQANFFYSNTADGYGPDRVVGLPNTGGVSPGSWFDNGGTTTNGTPINGITPARIASAGAYYQGRDYYGHSTTTNQHGEAGTTPALAGVVSGVTYHVIVRLVYGTSAAAYFRWLGGAGAVWEGSVAGTTYTPISGSVANAAVVTLNGEKYVSFDWTADAPGDLQFRTTPNSNTAGQYVELVDLSIRPYGS